MLCFRILIESLVNKLLAKTFSAGNSNSMVIKIEFIVTADEVIWIYHYFDGFIMKNSEIQILLDSKGIHFCFWKIQPNLICKLHGLWIDK